MKRIVFLLSLSLLTSPAWAAITFDAASSAQGGSSTSHNATIAADANIAIVCLTIRESGGVVAAASSVTVGGAAATFLSGVSHSGGVMRTELWYKLAPSTGTVAIAATADATTDNMITGVMTFKGVAQTSTFNTAATGQASTTNIDVDSVASAVGEMGVYCGSGRDTTAVAADATAPVSTERYENAWGAANIDGFGYTEDGAATSINMRVDGTGTSQWAAVAVSMRAAAASRRPSQPILLQ